MVVSFGLQVMSHVLFGTNEVGSRYSKCVHCSASSIRPQGFPSCEEGISWAARELSWLFWHVLMNLMTQKVDGQQADINPSD